jgi:hypothetical protein
VYPFLFTRNSRTGTLQLSGTGSPTCEVVELAEVRQEREVARRESHQPNGTHLSVQPAIAWAV